MITGITEHMTLKEARDALALAAAGAVIPYARGDIAWDLPNSTELQALRGFFWDAYRRGLVVLVQRRIGDRQYEYRAAVRRSRQGK
jgi:hypothetical protein